MVTLNPQIIKIPAFMTKFIDVDNLSIFQKVKLVIQSLISKLFSQLCKMEYKRG